MQNRRQFLAQSLSSGAYVAVLPWLASVCAEAAGSPPPRTPGSTGERIASQCAAPYRVYCAKRSERADVTTWAQIDLGSTLAIDAVRLYPTNRLHSQGDGFPVRFRIECAEAPSFVHARTVVDWSKSDYPDPNDNIIEFPAHRMRGRYVRLTVMRWRLKLAPDGTPDVAVVQDDLSDYQYYTFALAKIGVLSGGADVAVGCPVNVDALYGEPTDAAQLVRPARSMGEGSLTDEPANVTLPASWRPVSYQAQAPLHGVTLTGGPFRTALENNIHYLLDSFSVDELLRPFRERAGKPLPPGTRKPDPFWDEELAGSNAGRFLMGAGCTLQCFEHAELRTRMNAVVDGIAECARSDGYIMAYSESTFFHSERGAYTRSWLTHGLLEAAYAGHEKAFDLLRGYYDWYNRFEGLPLALRAAGQGGQGMVANSRLYFTPVGQPADLQILQRYFQENYWLEDLAARRVEAIWQYPYDHPHCYLLTNLEAYLDLYRATGEGRYLEAVKGAWQIVRENWQNIGGAISIIEVTECPPKSNSLYERLGETCGSAFWVLLNHRLHQLYPAEERYVNEIEKSFYNVVLANQDAGQGIRYHTVLVGHKEPSNRINTCCEGQGTRLLGSFAQYIYSSAPDGLYVNLFEASRIQWKQAGESIELTMETDFPKSPLIRLKIRTARALAAKIRVRVPSWASGVTRIEINGQAFAQGTPGSYVTLDRRWGDQDEIVFTLPMGFKMTRYEGVDKVQGKERYALEYGPLLMAALDAADIELVILSERGAMDLPNQLKPDPRRPLQFTLPASSFDDDTRFVPYYEIAQQNFSCFPVIKTIPSKALEY